MKQQLIRPFLLFLLLLPAGCTTTGPGNADNVVDTNESKWVILAAEEATYLKYFGFTGKVWTPQEEDVVTLEAELAPYLAQEYPFLHEQLSTYRRQYLGTTTDDGRRVIYANFFCDDHGMISEFDWQHEFVDMMDGGDCYFHTLYDVETETFLWVSINGES